MKRRSKDIIIINLVILLGMLISGFILQYGFRLMPCFLCIIQRWVIFGIIILSTIIIFLSYRIHHKILLICLEIVYWISLFGMTLLSYYHTAVEHKFIPPPSGCLVDIRNKDIAAIKESFKATMHMSCDIPQYFLGISISSLTSAATTMIMLISIYYMTILYIKK